MRLAVGLIAAAIALAGCTASPLLDGMNRISLSNASEPVPGNHKELLRKQLGLYRALDLQISAPRPLIAATVTEPTRWYVCVRTSAGTDTVHVISGGKLAGTIPTTPTATLCEGGAYELLG